MENSVLTLIGLGLTFVTCIGGLIVRDRAVMGIIDSKVAILHERCNKIRDEFVRRDDLDQHLGRLEKGMEKMYTEQRETNQRIDGFMTAMVNDHNDRRKPVSK